MNEIKAALHSIIHAVNWEALHCMIKGDPSVGEIMEALKRQNEIDTQTLKNNKSDEYLQVTNA